MSLKPQAKKAFDFNDANSALTSIAPPASDTFSDANVKNIENSAAKIVPQPALQGAKGARDSLFTTQIMDFANAVVPLFPTLPTFSHDSPRNLKPTDQYKANIAAILAKKKETDQSGFVEFSEEQITLLRNNSIGLIASRVTEEIAANPKSIYDVFRLLDDTYSKLYTSLYTPKDVAEEVVADEIRKAFLKADGITVSAVIACFDHSSGFTATLSKPSASATPPSPTPGLRSGAPKTAAKSVDPRKHWSEVSDAAEAYIAYPTSENRERLDFAYGVAYDATYELINKVNRKQFLSEVIAAEANTLLTDLKQEKDRVVAKLTTEIQNHQFWENIVPIVQVGFETRLEKLGRVFQINESEGNLWNAIGKKLLNC